MMTVRLSICIATYGRAKFIGETLDTILPQLSPDVELVIVDGASPDNTEEVINAYLGKYPGIRYYRQQENSGVDADYDKAVARAQGEYCWLMTDDDLMKPGAVQRVLDGISTGSDLVIVNTEVMTADFSGVLEARRLAVSQDRHYLAADRPDFFSTAANHLSFIGCVIIKRDLWLARDRQSYFGTLFVHVGVIFQQPEIPRTLVIAEPQISIRLGNAMWSPRGFEIWMFKWPGLIWSFPDFTEQAKKLVCHREPWTQPTQLLFYRAIGAYTKSEYQRLLAPRSRGAVKGMAYLIAVLPAALINFLGVVYHSLSGKNSLISMYELLRSKHAGIASRWTARLLRSAPQGLQ